jgi:sugar O-acyltransferase (sialic acid O-acetyltransferase NeuD family)
MPKILILGAGGHGKVIAEVASLMGKWNEISFLDDNDELKVVNGHHVIGRIGDYKRFREAYDSFFVAIGNNKLRLKLINQLTEDGLYVPVLQHPFSFVSATSKIGKGTVIMAGAVINTNAIIGRGCIINTSSSIDHDCVLEDGVHISPGVHVGGTTVVGQNSWICIGACISNNISIGKNSIIAAGAAVVKDVEDNILVGGVPARKIDKDR